MLCLHDPCTDERNAYKYMGDLASCYRTAATIVASMVVVRSVIAEG